MRVVASTLALAVLTGSALAQSTIHETEQADFTVETVAEGLEFPWSLAFLPDGDMLVTEREGRLRYIDDGTLREAPVEGLPDILVENQGGLLGLALHPEFAETRWVYFAFSEGTASANRTALARGRLSEDGRALNGVETLFRVNFEKERGYHFGGRIQFLDDGTLLLTLGDGGLHRNEAQNLGNHLGTIVRLNDDGSVPFDNPFVSAGGAQPEIWSYGHRNVQGIAINPATGSVWTHEHGARGGDEINIVEAGLNYGWPEITYGINYDGTPVSDATRREGLEQPIWFWDPSIAPSGLAFYRGEEFPEWQGDAFVGGLAGSMLVRYEVDGDRIISEEELLVERGERIRDVRSGPDGHLYILTDDLEGAVLRLDVVVP
ncbi:PQQ-dependent sugar dehydrogenase [Maricaulis sp.]|jgi:glucose/arabinose dehydrogenase|uniref:PQQ-dependent sugar dehydrogenase n=1 Tax=Maricaulis sp. TaxID=1486257 RepID=UPI002637975D|nr:PQQ-dependent sugar dehydrogenase [Maricaulis sp.]